MNTLRFVKQDQGQFTATLRKNVNNYFREKGISSKGNAEMVLKSVTMLCFYLAPFILLLTLPMASWVVFPLSAFMGIGMAGVGMSVMHDAAHGSFSRYRWVNKLFGSTMYLIGAVP